MDTFTVQLDGVLKTITPFANSPAGNRGPNNEARLPRMHVNLGGVLKEMPVIQASTIRGKLRRAAAMVVLDRMRAAGAQVSFEDWLFWALGGVKGSARDDVDALRRHQIIESCPILATFGAGASQAGGMVGGRFLIDPGIPATEIKVSTVGGARAAENRSPFVMSFLDPNEIEKVQLYTEANSERSGLSGRRKKLGSEIAQSERAIRERKPPKLGETELANAKRELESLDALIARAQEKAEVAIGRPLPGYEVMPAGLEMPHRMTIKAASRVQIGFVMDALREFAIDPTIGAHMSSGCGRIAAKYEVRTRRGRERESALDGSIEYGGHEGLRMNSNFLQECEETWHSETFDPKAHRA